LRKKKKKIKRKMRTTREKRKKRRRSKERTCVRSRKKRTRLIDHRCKQKGREGRAEHERGRKLMLCVVTGMCGGNEWKEEEYEEKRTPFKENKLNTLKSSPKTR